MVRKSQQDYLKAELRDRARKARAALHGPFNCPNCGGERALKCEMSQRIVKEEQDEKVRRFKETTYMFKCSSCDYIKVKHVHGWRLPSIVDIYCRVFDEDVTDDVAESQRSSWRPLRIRTIKLPATEVKM